MKPTGGRAVVMGNRDRDWLDQAAHDLGHVRNASAAGDFDWACFTAHQAAEKAVKALCLHLGGEAWGHSVGRILKDLQEQRQVPAGLVDASLRLDKHYIPTRSPKGFDSGSPHAYYTREEAERAIDAAQHIFDFCHQSFR
jgi:HEPN domain-containing protein